MKNASAPVTHYRKDYLPPDFLIETVKLKFELDPNATLVSSELMLRRNPQSDGLAQKLFLNGEGLTLKAIFIDDEELTEKDYDIDESGLTLNRVSDRFVLKTCVEIDPANNAALEGLYVSGDKFCTQCEAEGFRKITFYMDRPDVLAEFFVRIEADKTQYPLLLSNGNKIDAGDLSENKHYTEWHDPFLKPCYLFALVAGDLDLLADEFVTHSGRKIALELYVDKGKLDQSQFAMDSLKNAMAWDEKRYNLEYDLDLYMIVAVGDFNMGAMENKGLNIFNTKYVLANPATGTDQDFENIESVIGHEYFHNWTGNRVTCRDWFQLSLKEGLTVFRDQQFTEDMRSKAVKRIDDVKVIRSYQFAEDAGPMAHPIRPDAYIEMNNFYTVTVYNKGAEVIRMLHTLLGEEGFQKGMSLYFKRHDGSAATCDDFVAAMSDANQFNLDQFKYWYSQAGTPTLRVDYDYDESNQCLKLHFSQNNAHDSASEPYFIPVKLGLVGTKGNQVSFSSAEFGLKNVEEGLITVTQHNQTVSLEGVSEEVIPSLLRDFTAPVKLDINYSDQQLAYLFANDGNTFNRWDAGQRLMQRFLIDEEDSIKESIAEAFRTLLNDQSIDNAFKARCVQIPDLKTLFENDPNGRIDSLIERRKTLKKFLGIALEDTWSRLYNQLHRASDLDLDGVSVANRALKNASLDYMAFSSEQHEAIVIKQFEDAKLMTEELSAFSIANHHELEVASKITQAFYDKWHSEPLVMDKWLAIQASVDSLDTLNRIQTLRHDRVFNIKNPNKVRALFSTFAALNFSQFHRIDGAGYRLIAEAIIEIDEFNNQVAANLAKQFSSAAKLDDARKMHVQQQLKKVIDKENLSKDVFEVVSKTLESIE